MKKEKPRKYHQPAFAPVDKEENKKGRSDHPEASKDRTESLDDVDLYSRITAKTISSQRKTFLQKPSCCLSHHDQTPSTQTRNTPPRRDPVA